MKCVSCSQGYDLPYCTECIRGYSMDINEKCTICQGQAQDAATIPGYPVPAGTTVCVIKCVECPQGECYFDSGKLVCVSCYIGYIGNNCQTCDKIFEVGDYCFEMKETCLIHNNVEICQRCDETLVGDDCSQCSSLYWDLNLCFPIIRTYYGNYINNSQTAKM